MDDYAQGRNVTPLPSGIGSFTWETKIQALFPPSEWALADSYATAKLNVRDALGHVSGLPRYVLVRDVLMCNAHSRLHTDTICRTM